MSGDHRADLLACALDLIRGGVSIIPINHRDKLPAFDLLPVNPATGKAWWEPFADRVASDDEVRGWIDSGARAIAMVCGEISGDITILDFDEPGFLERWTELVGHLWNGLPLQRTQGGTYQVGFRCDMVEGNQKLAHVPDSDNVHGRRVAIETRGHHGYACVPPSRGPDGFYTMLSEGTFADAPRISQAHYHALLNAARELDEAPFTKQQIEASRRNKVRADDRAHLNGEASVIDAYNGVHRIRDVLADHGYAVSGNRAKRPGGRTFSVVIHDDLNTSYHHSTNDALSNGHQRDPFDVFTTIDHGGDIKSAVRKAAQQLGLKLHRTKPLVDETRAGKLETGVSSARQTLLKAAEPFQPFPIDALPYPLSSFAKTGAAAIGCDPSMIVLPLLVGLASAIGNTRRVRLKWDWSEPAIIWAAIVAGSGERKSPGFDAALRALREMQTEAVKEHQSAMAAYKAEMVEYKRKLNGYKTGAESELPAEPARPIRRRYLCVDATVEAIAALLEDSPRGLALVRDELAGWLGGMDAYKSGNKGADAAQWLEMYRGGALVIDRKNPERPSIFVPRAAVSVGGTIQPKVLALCLGSKHFDNGLAARLLLAMPPARKRVWTSDSIEPHVRDSIADVYKALSALDFDADGEPVEIPLSPDAQAEFVQFVNEHGAEQYNLPTDHLKAAWAKLEGYAARLALVIHLVRVTRNAAAADAVDVESLRSGIELVRWFANETKRCYADLALSDEDRERCALLDLVRERGGRLTPKELTRHRRRYVTTADARHALNELAQYGLGKWSYSTPGPGGGRPSEALVLFDGADETPAHDAETGSFDNARETEVGGV